MHAFQIHSESLGKRFNREWIFRDLSFTFEPRKIYAITGPNGSGKSTLLQILWGQLPPTSGKVTYSIGDQVIDADAMYQHVAVAAPYMDLIDEFTLKEQIDFHFAMRRPRKGHTPSTIADALYLQDALNKPISNFSSGMKQRVKLGLAFFTQSSVLFLDEPGTNLDRQALDWYIRNLAKYSAETLTLIASNQPDEYPQNAVRIGLEEYKQARDQVGNRE
jgi:ABC-type multidrug transport system ATPase subunit